MFTCELSSQFPHSIPFFNITYLSLIDLSSNDFNDTLPSWFFNISTLEDLDLSDNQLNGHFPDLFGHLVTLDL